MKSSMGNRWYNSISFGYECFFYNIILYPVCTPNSFRNSPFSISRQFVQFFWNPCTSLATPHNSLNSFKHKFDACTPNSLCCFPLYFFGLNNFLTFHLIPSYWSDRSGIKKYLFFYWKLVATMANHCWSKLS